MTSRPNSFVLFPIGKKRFALPAASVTELAHPDREQHFPHTSKLLTGVLVRRGHIIPVCDVAPVLVGPDAPPRKFFLIATRKFSDGSEWTAIPVSGECELTTAELLPPAGKLPKHVIGLLALDKEIIEVVDLERLIGSGVAA
ncbi:MAG: chemotaxis protein CheW [Candidatus Koribacter versatilis]|uniref:Chemotaxis protein CheW n=1 Tax=Candidatus Korobacter versatilis TaxID=658062 RepID=A0A932A8R5_9BACT|nr:chemotaxis protein CheW [Candidatus Koribacter versatilis]